MQYERFVKVSFDEYILPTKKYADIIIPRGGDNIVKKFYFTFLGCY